MQVESSTRRKFIKFLGISAGASMIPSNLIAKTNPTDNIQQLTDEQQKFMQHYDAWMDEFIAVIRVQKIEPFNSLNNSKLMELSEQAKNWQPILTNYMKDPLFAANYKYASQKMTNEIG